MAIHPGSGITGETLVDQVRAYLVRQGLVTPEGEFKPSPAHRLDRETSGVVVVAKTRQAMVRLTEIFTAGEADKASASVKSGGLTAGVLDSHSHCFDKPFIRPLLAKCDELSWDIATPRLPTVARRRPFGAS